MTVLRLGGGVPESGLKTSRMFRRFDAQSLIIVDVDQLYYTTSEMLTLFKPSDILLYSYQKPDRSSHI